MNLTIKSFVPTEQCNEMWINLSVVCKTFALRETNVMIQIQKRYKIGLRFAFSVPFRFANRYLQPFPAGKYGYLPT